MTFGQENSRFTLQMNFISCEGTEASDASLKIYQKNTANDELVIMGFPWLGLVIFSMYFVPIILLLLYTIVGARSPDYWNSLLFFIQNVRNIRIQINSKIVITDRNSLQIS